MDEVRQLGELLGLGEGEKEALLTFALEEAKELARNYCNIEEIPKGLSNTVIRMALDIWRREGFGEEDSPDSVSSVKLGDTTVSFGTTMKQEAYETSILKDYKKQLKRYRRVGFR